MSRPQSNRAWNLHVSVRTRVPPPRCPDGLTVATMFCLHSAAGQTLYDDFGLSIKPGQKIGRAHV